MTDLTAITTPFGLLDAETQRTLRAHGGPIQRYSDDGEWVFSDHPCWYPGNAYRVKPTPPKLRECWSYGAHLRDTLAAAEKFRADVDKANPGNGYLNHPITKWVEVLP